MTNKISIIIVAYINVEDVKNCIESIKRHNDVGDALEIIIVDNSPNMKLYNFVRDNYSDVTIIKNENTGFGDANNKGVDVATGNIMFFLNPDTILIEPIFQHVVDRMQDSTIGILGFKLLTKDLRKNSSFGWIDRDGLVNNQLLKLYKKINYFNDKKMYIEGANMIIRKDVFELAGGFDSNLFMYFEEQDLSKRVLGLGYRNVFDSSRSLIHLQGGSSSKATLHYELESFKYYCDKYHFDFQKKLIKKIWGMKFKMIFFKFVNTNKYKYYLDTLKIYEEARYDN